MSKESNQSSLRIGPAGVVFLIFLVLKLTKVGEIANWSWWWVTSPLWIALVLVFVIACVAAFVKAMK